MLPERGDGDVVAWSNVVTANENEYYPWFDYLRGALAFVVMLGHGGVINIAHSGNFCVQVFFALSGWLIGGILVRLSSDDLPRFYFNRAIRIWTPYYIALALILAASLLRDPLTAKWLEFVLYKVSFVYNLFGPRQLAQFRYDMPLDGTGNHFWSVNAEEQFYLLAPLLLVVASKWLGRNTLTWVVLAFVAWIARTYASIVFGVLAAVVVDRYGPIHRMPWARGGIAVVTAASFTSLILGLDYDLLVPVCSVGIVLLLAVQGSKSPVGALLGGMSYPLYLNHWIGVFVAHAMLGPWGLRDSRASQALAVVFNLGIALALYWWIDRRMLARRAEWFSPSRGKLATYLAYGLVAAGIAFGLAKR
jgi:peptidoglycan/LPS O-acetylase OafA/YrhL